MSIHCASSGAPAIWVFPIEEIGRLLAQWQGRNRASADGKALAFSRPEELRRKERESRAMRKALEELARSCHGNERHDCPILEDLAQDG